MSYNPNQAFLDNLEAIRTMFQLEKSGLAATPQQISILRSYSGFGGLKCVLLPTNNLTDWSQEDKKLYPSVKVLESLLSANTANTTEYNRYLNSIRSSVLTAFYTPPELTDVIVDCLYQSGLKGRNILEPSCGHGEFINSLLKKGKDHNIYPIITGYEKDIITSKICHHIYRDKVLYCAGFEEIPRTKLAFFDLVVSNIPFNDTAVFDPLFVKDKFRKQAAQKIHNYFFIKGLDTLRDGGTLAFITSTGVLDAPSNQYIREYLMRHSDLVSAIRLPCNTFENTKVGCDLIILQRNNQKERLSEREEKFIATIEIDGVTINSLFSSPDHIVFSERHKGKNLYGKEAIIYTEQEGITKIAQKLRQILTRDLEGHFPTLTQTITLSQGIENIPEVKIQAPLLSLYDLYDAQERNLDSSETITITPPKQSLSERRNIRSQRKEHIEMGDLFSLPPENIDPFSTKPREFSSLLKPFYKDGILIFDKGQIGHLRNFEHTFPTFHPLQINYYLQEKIEAYIRVRDFYQELYYDEAKQRKENSKFRDKLNQAYDYFVNKYGDLNDKSNAKNILMDACGIEILSLEKFVAGEKIKADIFYKPVSFSTEKVEHTDNVDEALAISLNKYGKVDLNFISELTDKEDSNLLQELKGQIYYNPLNSHYEISSKFLSGDVVEKMSLIEKYLTAHPDDELSQESCKALKQVAPEQITFDELDFNLGERWIPSEIYSDFVSNLFETEVKIELIVDWDQFIIHCPSRNAIINQKFSVNSRHDGIELLHHALYNTVPIITKKIRVDGEERKVVDNEATQLAGAKIEEIRNAFPVWLENQSQTLRDNLVDRYNKLFNNSIRPEYDGSHQKFPDLNLKGLGITDLYKSQKDCIWMLKQNAGGICDHEVGLGKTLIMAITSQEMKRLGLVHKPIILALPNNVDQIIETCKTAYPKAKILSTTKKEFTPKQRVQFFNSIRNNNWDLIILTHDQFSKIPQSMEIQQKTIETELESIRQNLEVIRDKGFNISKQMEKGVLKRQENLEAKLRVINYIIASRKDDVVDFKMLGIDHIFVDESHQFKNLPFTTRHDRVAGIGNSTGSQRALNLLYAIRTIQEEKHVDCCATFLSGTIISNSLSELYSLHKYLRPKALARQNINCIDAWLATYAVKSTDYEFSVTNEIIPKERFRQYIKVQELVQFHRQITDYRTAKEINIDRPEPEEVLFTTELTPQQIEFQKKLIEFAKTGDAELLDRPRLTDNESRAKMLIATNYSRKMALDMRLVNPYKYHDEQYNKLSHCAKQVAELYHQYNFCKGTQFIFSDLGTYKPGEDLWNVYSELKRKLVEDYHIPPQEIRFAQEFQSEKQRLWMKQSMNKGNIRVLLGSTLLLGTGCNAQEKVIAIHHLDIPWTPKDLTQRNGRGIRTGNLVAKQYADNKVKLYVYATKNSLDVYKFTLLKNKQLFIEQIRSGCCSSRRLDEGALDAENGCSYAEYVAILSGNTDLLEKSRLEKKIVTLQNERHVFYRNQNRTKGTFEYLKSSSLHLEDQINNLRKDWKEFKDKIRYDEKEEIINPLKLINCETTDIKILGEKLNAINRAKTVYSGKKIGTYLSFAVKVDSRMLSEKSYNYFYVEGSYKYTYNNGHLATNPELAVASFTKALNAIPALISSSESKKKEADQEIVLLQRIISETWTKEDQLAQLKKAHDELERKINQELKLQSQSDIKSVPEEKDNKATIQNNINNVLKNSDVKEIQKVKIKI